MKEFTYSEARQRLAALLERARREGAVRIRRKDGQVLFCGRSPRPADPRCDQRGPTPRPISTGVEALERLADFEGDPGARSTWEEVKARILRRDP
ncbi:MAG: hypothetical protein H0T44_07190 [Gemmatimonadales bacterium]|nr:hypothetical protein [Gemmatimonadales bacterium]